MNTNSFREAAAVGISIGLASLLVACSSTIRGRLVPDAGDDLDAPRPAASDASVPSADATATASPPDAGGGRSLCDTFCTDVLIGCPEPYRDRATCEAICAVLPEGPASQDPHANVNNVRCRLSPIADGGAHSVPGACYGTGPCGGDHCGQRCEGFCTLAMARCRAPLPQPFTSPADCLTTCRTFDFNDGIDEYSDDPSAPMNCREHHVVEAFRPGADAALHCKALARNGSACAP